MTSEFFARQMKDILRGGVKWSFPSNTLEYARGVKGENVEDVSPADFKTSMSSS